MARGIAESGVWGLGNFRASDVEVQSSACPVFRSLRVNSGIQQSLSERSVMAMRKGILVMKRALADAEVNVYNGYWGPSATDILSVTSRTVGGFAGTRPTFKTRPTYLHKVLQ